MPIIAIAITDKKQKERRAGANIGTSQAVQSVRSNRFFCCDFLASMQRPSFLQVLTVLPTQCGTSVGNEERGLLKKSLTLINRVCSRPMGVSLLAPPELLKFRFPTESLSPVAIVGRLRSQNQSVITNFKSKSVSSKLPARAYTTNVYHARRNDTIYANYCHNQ